MKFYFNWPWILDEKDYNCSSRAIEQWLARGKVNYVQGAYFTLSGIVFIFVYTLSLAAMYKKKLLRIPCYQLMFFGGIMDIITLLVCSVLVGYYNFRGSVFCSDEILQRIGGNVAWCSYIGASFNCVALALNRVVEMLPVASNFKFLCRGKYTYMWIFLNIFYMTIRLFFTRAGSYNSSFSSYLLAPLITDDIAWELSHYSSILLPVHNIAVVTILSVSYTVLCLYVLKEKRCARSRLDRAQLLIFVQIFVICASTSVAALLYVYMNFFEVPLYVLILANVVWQMSHGIHGFVYVLLNTEIRKGVWSLLCCNRSGSAKSSLGMPTITIEQKESKKSMPFIYSGQRSM